MVKLDYSLMNGMLICYNVCRYEKMDARFCNEFDWSVCGLYGYLKTVSNPGLLNVNHSYYLLSSNRELTRWFLTTGSFDPKQIKLEVKQLFNNMLFIE